MNKRGLFNRNFSITLISLIVIFMLLLWIFPVNPEDLSGNVVKRNIIEEISPTSNKEVSTDTITLEVITKEPAVCKSSKMKIGGYYLPYVDFERTNDYYHKTTLNLENRRNNFKIYCKQIDSKIYDYNYWSIKRII